jgi:hypothetical protein
MKKSCRGRHQDTASGVEWLGDHDEALLFDRETGGILGRYSHEGHGNWRVEVYVPPWREWMILEEEPWWLASLLPFPKCVARHFRATTFASARRLVRRHSSRYLRRPRAEPGRQPGAMFGSARTLAIFRRLASPTSRSGDASGALARSATIAV